MSNYSKWLGGGLGWLVGGPVGGLLGFAAGNLIEEEPEVEVDSAGSKTSELESCLLIMASHITKADGSVSLKEINAVRKLLINAAGETNIESKMSVFQHCLQHTYALEKACGFIRIYQSETTAIQCLKFMFEVAACDGAISEKEQKLLFYISGLLNIHDIAYRKLIKDWSKDTGDDYSLFFIQKDASPIEIRNTYRKLVLKYHPDRNPGYTDLERKQAERKLQQLREAYERLSNH